jgi:hypothetical protein
LCDASPWNQEELFNLCHAQARNVVERIFGVIKKRWDILTRAPHFDMAIQARIPAGLAALHNFIMKYDIEDAEELVVRVNDDMPGDIDYGSFAVSHPSQAEKEQADQIRDQIAQDMWDSYQLLLQERGQDIADVYLDVGSSET